MNKNPQKWMMVKNRALYEEIKKQGKKLIFGLGGESDLKGFMTLEQVQDFANYVVYMLGIAGDGINLDFEHMSENANKQQQFKVMAHLLHYTKKALKEAGFEDKKITYTCKYNAVYKTNRPQGFTPFASDGELVDVANILA